MNPPGGLSSLVLPTEPKGAREAAHNALKAVVEHIRDTYGLQVNAVKVGYESHDGRPIVVQIQTDVTPLTKLQ